MVLHDRIELSTSPLPRECSTTELVQRRGGVISRTPRKVQPPRHRHAPHPSHARLTPPAALPIPGAMDDPPPPRPALTPRALADKQAREQFAARRWAALRGGVVWRHACGSVWCRQ